ncbi:hypothetical protein JOB18_004038 [Solea senegalensis]|uniref:Uncharacterized protein n=1 Tax=Solea senegalensis TaxID=28829 RepID=A0AAV6QVH4_SOLSE|nr:hypothetical protein JOB18_004038 [Solea senegalensis]
MATSWWLQTLTIEFTVWTFLVHRFEQKALWICATSSTHVCDGVNKACDAVAINLSDREVMILVSWTTQSEEEEEEEEDKGEKVGGPRVGGSQQEGVLLRLQTRLPELQPQS